MMLPQETRSLPCPGYSIWNPCGIHGIHQEFHMESMEWMLAETPANFLFHGHHGFHMEWGWNGHGLINSIWIPHGFHRIPYGMLAYPPWIPWNSPYGFHGNSAGIPEKQPYLITKNSDNIKNWTPASTEYHMIDQMSTPSTALCDHSGKKVSSINIVVCYLHPKQVSANPDTWFVVVINNQQSTNTHFIPTTTTIDANWSHRLTSLAHSHHSHQPPTALTAHMDDNTNNLPKPGHRTSTAVWIVETTWQMCHIEYVQVSMCCPPPSSSHTQIQGPPRQQGDVAAIWTVQRDNNTTNHDDTTTEQQP